MKEMTLGSLHVIQLCEKKVAKLCNNNVQMFVFCLLNIKQSVTKSLNEPKWKQTER